MRRVLLVLRLVLNDEVLARLGQLRAGGIRRVCIYIYIYIYIYIHVPLWYSRLFLQRDASRGSVTGLEGRPLTFGEVQRDEAKSTELAHPRRQSYYVPGSGWVGQAASDIYNAKDYRPRSYIAVQTLNMYHFGTPVSFCKETNHAVLSQDWKGVH